MSGLGSSKNLLSAPMVIRMVLAVGKHLQVTKVIILDKLWFQKLSQKTIPWACLGSGPPGTCWWLPWWSGWSWLSGNTFKIPIWSYLTNLVSKTVSKNIPWGCPGSGPPGTCWRPSWWSRFSWLSRNYFKSPIWSYLTTLVWKIASKNQSLGMLGLRSYR